MRLLLITTRLHTVMSKLLTERTVTGDQHNLTKTSR
jgi:hypothetical protein